MRVKKKNNENFKERQLDIIKAQGKNRLAQMQLWFDIAKSLEKPVLKVTCSTGIDSNWVEVTLDGKQVFQTNEPFDVTSDIDLICTLVEMLEALERVGLIKLELDKSYSNKYSY